MLNATRFTQLWHRLRGTSDPDPHFAALSAAYAEPHRAYHNAAHISDCLAQFDAVRNAIQRPNDIEMALWFHDAVYDPKAADNEEQSAAWAVRALCGAGVLAEIADRVATLILATKHATLPEELGAQLLTDVDLSILGRAPEVFDAYDRAIRVEYQWVPEPHYREARARILGGFLDRAAIFHTAYFQVRYEKQARENLQRVIASLKGHPG